VIHSSTNRTYSGHVSFTNNLVSIWNKHGINGVAETRYDKFIVRAPKNNTSKNAELMKCPECQSTHVNKNGQKKVNRIIFVSVVADNL
jgi:hypothetical protein